MLTDVEDGATKAPIYELLANHEGNKKVILDEMPPIVNLLRTIISTSLLSSYKLKFRYPSWVIWTTCTLKRNPYLHSLVIETLIHLSTIKHVHKVMVLKKAIHYNEVRHFFFIGLDFCFRFIRQYRVKLLTLHSQIARVQSKFLKRSQIKKSFEKRLGQMQRYFFMLTHKTQFLITIGRTSCDQT